jgi:hypothetical protein
VEWAAIVNAVEEIGPSYCKVLRGKPFLVPYTSLIQTFDKLEDFLKASTLADQTNSPKATGQQTMQ